MNVFGLESSITVCVTFNLRDGHWKTIVSLLNLGASINLKDVRNQSPLHFGCRYEIVL